MRDGGACQGFVSGGRQRHVRHVQGIAPSGGPMSAAEAETATADRKTKIGTGLRTSQTAISTNQGAGTAVGRRPERSGSTLALHGCRCCTPKPCFSVDLQAGTTCRRLSDPGSGWFAESSLRAAAAMSAGSAEMPANDPIAVGSHIYQASDPALDAKLRLGTIQGRVWRSVACKPRWVRFGPQIESSVLQPQRHHSNLHQRPKLPGGLTARQENTVRRQKKVALGTNLTPSTRF